MRYVSEQFKEKQDRLIRPALSLYFEVCSDVTTVVIRDSFRYYSLFDTTVAPTKFYEHCANEYYYAVVGDGISVDDPNRMCAPDNSGVIATPTHSVPFGVTTVFTANTEALFGSSTFSSNIIGLNTPVTFSFKGGLIPEKIRVEVYDFNSSTWSTVQTIDNPDLSEEIVFVPDALYYGKYHRFYFNNTTKSGRYQLNWIRSERASSNNATPIVFKDNRISSVSISEATDLTSQTEPSYDLTVTCLDVNGEYSPDSEYWERAKQFTDGKKCYLSAGYKNSEGDVELIPLLIGDLMQKPTYDQKKITFKVSAWAKQMAGRINLYSLPNNSLNTGDEVTDRQLSTIFGNFYNNTDIFHGNADDTNSKSNCYNSFGKGNASKLIANALGGYITIDPNSINLYNTCDIQYKLPADYLTRNEQTKCSLESQPKVHSTGITRNKNTLSADYVDVEATERVSVSAGGNATTSYNLSFFAFGKGTVVDYQSSVPSAVFTIVTTYETLKLNGDITVSITIRSNVSTTIKPIFRFYRVENTQYDENETIDSNGSEEYTNNNEIVTNTYLTDKVKRVARFMSDVSNQYEVDVVQDLRYEIGDVIRLETEKNVFKTCVITALKFNLPGSTGHVTCRKIFSLFDCSKAVIEPRGVVVSFTGDNNYFVGENSGAAVFGELTIDGYVYFYGVGYSTFIKNSVEHPVNKKLVDLNGHTWDFFFYRLGTGYYTRANPFHLPAYDSTKGADKDSWGAIELIKAIYNEQGMTPPVDYTCTLVNP